MRLRMTVLILALALLAAPSAVPSAVRAAVPSAGFVRAASRIWAPQVNCSGIVEQQNRRQVFLSSPVIADQILVAPGDRVQEGDALAYINTDLTKNVLSQSVLVRQQAQRESPLSGLDADQLSQAAALYGVSLNEILPGLEASDALERIEEVYEAPPSTIMAVPNTILSPMSGIVTEVNLESGVLSQGSTAAFTVADDSLYQVRAAVSENLVGSLVTGDLALVGGPALGDQTYHGIVTSISPSAKRTASSLSETASVEVLIAILDPNERLKSGYSASADITSQNSRHLVTLPYEAIRQDAMNQEYVLVYQQGHAVRRNVSTGEELANCVEIVSGVLAEDAVLIASDSVTEGSAVRLGEEWANA